MEYSSVSTQPPITLAQGWASRSVNESWSASEAVSGSSPNREEVQRFTLPSQWQENPNELAPVEQTSRLIILVEDNVGDARLVREALENSAIACELIVITNGQRAIQFIEDLDSGSGRCPQLAIVDLNLPKKPGAEVVRRMRASVKCRDVPVVVLTSSNNQIDRENAKSIGVSRYIVKSGRLSEILELGSVFRDLLGLSNDMER